MFSKRPPRTKSSLVREETPGSPARRCWPGALRKVTIAPITGGLGLKGPEQSGPRRKLPQTTAGRCCVRRLLLALYECVNNRGSHGSRRTISSKRTSVSTSKSSSLSNPSAWGVRVDCVTVARGFLAGEVEHVVLCTRQARDELGLTPVLGAVWCRRDRGLEPRESPRSSRGRGQATCHDLD